MLSCLQRIINVFNFNLGCLAYINPVMVARHIASIVRVPWARHSSSYLMLWSDLFKSYETWSQAIVLRSNWHVTLLITKAIAWNLINPELLVMQTAHTNYANLQKLTINCQHHGGWTPKLLCQSHWNHIPHFPSSPLYVHCRSQILLQPTHLFTFVVYLQFQVS